MIPKEVLERLVIDTTVKELSKPENMDQIVKGILAVQQESLQNNSILTTLQREQTNVNIALENILSAIERGIVSKTTNKRLHELEERLEYLERQILIEKSKTVVQIQEKDIRTYYEQMLRLQPQLLINMVIKEIILFDDEVKIVYNSPLKNGSDES